MVPLALNQQNSPNLPHQTGHKKNPESTYRSNIEFRGSTDLVSDSAADTLQLPISHVMTREMALNREVSVAYFEPNSNTPESEQLPCPQSNTYAYHKRKKILRKKQSVASSSLHTRPDLIGDGNDGQCDNQQHNPLYNGSALYNYSNDDRFAKPIFNNVADENRRITDLGKAVTDGDTRNTCGSGERFKIDGECCNSDTNNGRWMDMRKSEVAPGSERFITSDPDTAGHGCDSDPQ
ncbi:hypothetical protein ACJRO7_027274 [Eucalyptus globulus]|uniref:Uncharacterized protein n=1 Tax=Eucalyptus globulus TaxID=34317 RepID=A0ABD3K0W7_EUCGL